ncbi:hypothetical protein PSTG_11227 [Puccinia striiformis f. sp. tritici PST-78]|uniref:Uncharacterized protein n=1 Tax=Puccinia striiformis f. sp. tritici PST-78 TaxID=1165861 RepID=A0A0L0V8R0_9BASI|nr:hypothetical protein PSTG_11227 [Puccinia striiformis f. sp. tritici PST-78]
MQTLDTLHTQSDEDHAKRIACESSCDVSDVTTMIGQDHQSSNSSSNHINNPKSSLIDRISLPLFDHRNINIE